MQGHEKENEKENEKERAIAPHVPNLDGAILAAWVHPATLPLKSHRRDIVGMAIKAGHLRNSRKEKKKKKKEKKVKVK